MKRSKTFIYFQKCEEFDPNYDFPYLYSLSNINDIYIRETLAYIRKGPSTLIISQLRGVRLKTACSTLEYTRMKGIF